MFVKVEEFFWNWWCGWFIIRVMVWFKVWVFECFFYCDVFDWVESEKFFEEIECEIGGFGKECFEWNFFFERERLDVFVCML